MSTCDREPISKRVGHITSSWYNQARTFPRRGAAPPSEEPDVNDRPVQRFLRKGMTMVEIMVVVILLGILSAIAVPKFMATSGLSQLDADANRLLLLLREARSKAVSSGVMHFVKVDPTTGAFGLYKDDLDNAPDAGDVFVKTDTLGTSVRFGFGSNWSAVPSVFPIGATGFSATTVPTSGLAPGTGASAGGTECALDPASAGTWADNAINFCPGVLGDVETGALYLTTSRSTAKAYAMLYNDLGTQGGLQIRRYVLQGNSWTLN